MIASQRALHARVWPVIAAVLLVAVALALFMRRPTPLNDGPLPGAGAAKPAGGPP